MNTQFLLEERPLQPTVLRATHLGMCFGVRDAIALALDQSQPITILGDLVHNETVLNHLRSQGVQIEHQVAAIGTSNVMITAHGASERARADLRARGFNIIEATCPLVSLAHRAVMKLAREGFHPVIIGKRDHVEVRGLTEDLAEFDVILAEQDVEALQPRQRFGVAAQTTQPLDRVRRLIRLLRERFPATEVRFIDTVCQPTKQRQTAAIDLARKCDVVLVVGGAHSNNTRELVSTCSRFCSRVHHVQTADDVRVEWLDGAATIGITAGTSTPESVIDEVEAALKRITNGFGRQRAPLSTSQAA
jgi:4-hydroxy-3-methylbut-2-enyl diphosphate reductase